MAQDGDTFESRMQTSQYKIVFRDPETILKKHLGDEVTIVDFESEPFSKFGDNFGSTVMKITVSVKRKDVNRIEKLNLVGKLLPATDFQRQIFESGYSFQKEIFFYEELIPAYREIYKKEFNIVPQYYGSRMDLGTGNGKLDEDAVLLLENLKIKGYYMEDKYKGFDLEHLKVIVPAIAKFHAIGLAVKKKNPSFIPVLKKYTRRLALLDTHKQMIEKMTNDIKENSEVSQYYDRIKTIFDNSADVDYYFKNTLELEEPWACVVHLDLWVNNMLFHRDENDKIDDVKMVDFQTYTVCSPLVDIIFLLCTSMQYPIEHFDAMIELYRNTVYRILKELDCDPCLFEKENFEERMKIDAIAEIFHIIIMANVVEYRDGDDFTANSATELVIRRWKRVFEIFEQKKWL